MRFQPWQAKLATDLSPQQALQALSGRPFPLLLESSLRLANLGRYSFVAADPVAIHSCSTCQPDPLTEIQSSLDQWQTQPLAGLPPFQGGWAGLLSYDLGGCFESLPELPAGAVQVPRLLLALYDVVLAWDHATGEAWLISQGLPETDLERRSVRAAERGAEVLEWLHHPGPFPTRPRPSASLDQLPPGFVRLDEHCASNFTEAEYLQAVRRTVEYIRAGDLFQTNLSQQVLLPATCTALELYQRLRETNPSPFAGFFDAGDFQIISSSPERLVQVRDRNLETRPIKGTRRRTRIPQVDISVARELETNEKERAENTMIVDLMRNDFSRICTDDSVQVTQWCGIESYETVFHLVSAIVGTLREDVPVTEVIRAIFPGGSVTGAPKIRAMEIIAELEGISRGPYCGSLGYLALSGDCDFNILIRSVTAQRGWWQLPVGGAIVAQSKPEQEYAETWTKAAAVLRACLRQPTREARQDPGTSPEPLALRGEVGGAG